MNVRVALFAIILCVSVPLLLLKHDGKGTRFDEADSPRALFDGTNVTMQMVDEARDNARKQRKVLMVEFGANWCGDCQALSSQFASEPLRKNLQSHFILLKVDVGRFDRNTDVAKSMGIDLNKGIPSAVFLAWDGPSLQYGTNQILAFLRDF